MKKLATIIKALSDDTRLRVMKLLEERELCVCELMQVLEMSQPRISRHLSVLRNAGLVDDRREGKWVYYSLRDDTASEEVKSLLRAVASLANDNPTVEQDKKALTKAARLSEMEGKCAQRTA